MAAGEAQGRSAEAGERRPDVSVVVVAYNIAREAPRTLLSLSAGYQRHIHRDDYEVVVVDNGSDPPLDPRLVARLDGHFRLIRIDCASASPAHAINRGLAEARGDVIGVMIDGARIATPGLLHFARHGARLHDTAVVATLGWYLGPGFQRESMAWGYDRAAEDGLLSAIDWPSDGYRLFEIGAMDESSVDGWFQPISESNALFLRRELWTLLDGVDESFDAPGGGLVNLDTFCRALELPDAALVVLLGEATFHQLHGGLATNAPPDRHRDNMNRWTSQYARIRGRPSPAIQSQHVPSFIGTLPRSVLPRLVRAATHPDRCWDANVVTARWGRLVRTWRLIRARARYERKPLLPRVPIAPWKPPPDPPGAQRARHHVALADGQRRLGENEAAASNYRAALTFDPAAIEAHCGLAALRMPGDDYMVWLERLYRSLAPETAIEIGIYEGASLGLLQPPTIAIGVDPAPNVQVPLKAVTHIFVGTSDEFFAKRRPDLWLAGRPLSVGFIDGLHLFEQALRDFINLELYCGPHSVILFHDTVPLDEPTQARTRKTLFHTGDVWKTILCLKYYRTDLEVFTIPASPTGLTVVAGLDPGSRVLADRYDEAVARFAETSFSEVEGVLDTALDLVPNDWAAVRSRLTERGVDLK